MNKIYINRKWIRLIVIPLLVVGITNAQSEAERPNVILIMTDDQGWGDTGYNGHPHLKTPNLDRMSREDKIHIIIMV